MSTPREIFEENLRPAQLLLSLHRLLENDQVLTNGHLIDGVRALLTLSGEEVLMAIQNGCFLGVIREAANVHPGDLKKARLDNLLRQAVVASCSAMETYLYTLTETNLETVISLRGRDFLDIKDKDLMNFLNNMPFKLEEVLSYLAEPDGAASRLGVKVLNLVKDRYLKGASAIGVVGALMGLSNTWDQIAARLSSEARAREKRRELEGVLREVVDRRKEIVHRADRPESGSTQPPRGIEHEKVDLWVQTIAGVCRTLDRLVAERLEQLRDSSQASQKQEAW